MADARARAVEAMLRDVARLHEQAAHESVGAVIAAADTITTAFRNGGKVLLFGNGGSAADAQHFAGELVGRFLRERQALPALALTTDTSILTAIANDYEYERVFVRQIEALGRPGDVAVGISTSGASRNVLAAIRCAKSQGLTTMAFTGGTGGPIGAEVDVVVNVPHPSTPRIQEVHRTLIHAICELIESELPDMGGQS